MSQVVAVFGAGSGLCVALARRFGREGFQVALIARRAEKLHTLVQELAAEGIEAAAFAADLSEPQQAQSVVEAITEHFGRTDVVSYQPLPRLGPLVNLFLLTPVEIAHPVVPEMTKRGSGGFIVTGMHVIDPDELAETYRQLYTNRSQVEYRFPAPARN